MALNQLKLEIDQRKKEIHADSYPMSIGEVINLYRDGELEINPEFQRFFRWTPQQKTNLIESILLGIPVPSFFVSQRDDGVWEVVDGLQRLSTILEFVGELKDENGNYKDPFKLLAAKYLTSLKDLLWNQMDKSLQIDFKREKIDFKIIKKESTPDTKYELFQRLNTGGSALSNQEVRNCILIMQNRTFFEWLESLAENEDYKSCTPLSSSQVLQRFNLELITRFMVFMNHGFHSIGEDVASFITENISELAIKKEFNFGEQKKCFDKVFHMLNVALSDDVFRKFDEKKNKYIGPFSLTRYEAITFGLGKNIDYYDVNLSDDVDLIKEKIKELCSDSIFKFNSGSGTNARGRIPKILPLAERIFKR